jgi:hypothetical protein
MEPCVRMWLCCIVLQRPLMRAVDTGMLSFVCLGPLFDARTLTTLRFFLRLRRGRDLIKQLKISLFAS